MLFERLRQRRREKKLARAKGSTIVDALASRPVVENSSKLQLPSAELSRQRPKPPVVDEEDIYDDTDVESLSDIAPNDVDREFAAIVNGFLKSPDLPTTNGALRNVQIVGQLHDGGWGWVCLDVPAWGQCDSRRLESFGCEMPQPGDAFRARVRSYGALHFIDSIDKHSLVRVGEARRQKPSVPAQRPPARVRNTWRADLQPGDIVVARIPFGPLAGVDGAGRTSKIRPAVFVGWTEDEAIVRRISKVGGYLDRNGGVRLRNTPNLKKDSVVSFVDQYVDIDGISKKLTRIHPTDAGHAQISLATSYEIETVERREPSKMLRFDPLIDATVATLDGRPLRDDREILELLLLGLRPSETALLFSVLGDLERIVCSRLGIPKPTKKMFERVVAISRTSGTGVQIIHDENGHPVVTFNEQRPANNAETQKSAESEPADFSTFGFVYPVIPEDYTEPDVIILDQLACHLMLQDRRTNLAEALAILRNESFAPSFLIGSADAASLQRFQTAARYSGWTVMTVDTREATLEKAVEAVRTVGASFVTVVTDRADIVAEIEAYGYDVTIIREWA